MQFLWWFNDPPPSNGHAELLADWRLRYTVLKRYTSEVECGRWRRRGRSRRRCGNMQNFRFHRWLALSLDFHVNLALTWICRPLSLTGLSVTELIAGGVMSSDDGRGSVIDTVISVRAYSKGDEWGVCIPTNLNGFVRDRRSTWWVAPNNIVYMAYPSTAPEKLSANIVLTSTNYLQLLN